MATSPAFRITAIALILGALNVPGRAATPDFQGEPIKPIVAEAGLDPRRVALGEFLFHDKRLSHDESLSCASCHDLKHGGVDGKPVSTGIGGARGAINAPTVFNSGLNFRQLWNGKAATLEEQAAGPLQSPDEMGSNWDEVVTRLARDPAVIVRFAAVYDDGINARNIADAIATFERSLRTPNSRFDRYLRGEPGAITADEQKGYELFKRYGCVSCHQGVAVGGNMFQKFGVMGDYFAKRGNVTAADQGRFNVTKKESDRHVFKVPSLRNVALTAPYFHDGSAKDLDEAVAVMFRYQLGRAAPRQDQERIVQFLRTLTGEYRGQMLDRPEPVATK